MRLFWRNDNYVLLEGLRDAATGEFVNDAMLTLSIKDENRATISGASAISFTYIAASDGRYKALVPATVQLTIGTVVKGTITCSNYGLRYDDVPIDIEKRSGLS